MLNGERFGRVAVLMGGASSEREISLFSGQAVLDALRQAGVSAEEFDPAQRPMTDITRFDRAFIALHGRGGEDGAVQGLLETLGIPYTGSGVLASALAMDKWRTKLLWQACGLPTPPARLIDAATDWSALADELGLPLMIKPAHEGSSVGLSKVTQLADLPAAWAAARQYDAWVLAERFIVGQELTGAFLGSGETMQALPIVRIEAPDGNYDYHNKYFSDETRYFCPAGLTDEREAKLRTLVLRAAQALGCRGWGRADLILTDDGQPYLLEMNTVPGMTAHSLVPMAARAAGLDFDALVLTLLQGASRD